MIRFNYFTYALMNTTIFLPYFLFIIIGNSYHTILNGWFPLIIFYTFKYTGPFLINSFQSKIKTRELLLTFIALATVGAFCGVLAPLSPIWIELAAILMGTSTSILLPLYTTTQFHEKYFYGRKMQGTHFLLALLTVLIMVPLVLITAHSHFSNLAFLIYGIALLICFLSLRQMPKYEIAVIQNSNFKVQSFIVFILFTAVIFIIKATRKTDLQIFMVLLIIGSLTVLAIMALLIRKFKVQFHLPKYIHFFAFLQGMSANFFLLYGTFYSLSQKSNHFMTFRIYLPYGLGIIFSLFLGGRIMKQFNRFHPFLVISVGSFCGLLLTLIPCTITIGGFFIGFFNSLLTKNLNRLAYDVSETYKDSSLLLRNRWSKLGRMINQTILVLLILLSSYLNHIPINQVFLIITGKSTQYRELMYTNLMITGVIIVLIIGSLLSYGNFKMKERTEC